MQWPQCSKTLIPCCMNQYVCYRQSLNLCGQGRRLPKQDPSLSLQYLKGRLFDLPANVSDKPTSLIQFGKKLNKNILKQRLQYNNISLGSCYTTKSGVYPLTKIAISQSFFKHRKYFFVLQNALAQSDECRSVNHPKM